MADKDDDTLAFIKTITTQGQREAVLQTVIDQHSVKVPIVGMPVVWSSTFDTPTKKNKIDPGNQQYNRFFLISIDETDDQGRIIDDFQAEEAVYGVRFDETPNLTAARHIVKEIFENEKQRRLVVLNPFAPWIHTAPGPRNRRPMLETLIKAVAYANHYQRPQFEDDKTRLVLASKRDVETAVELW